MNLIEILKAAVLGLVQGITEWLPISSTGHMIILDEFLHLQVTPAFREMFFVVIQLASILAVIILFFRKLNPFEVKGGLHVKRSTMVMWLKILIASVPAGIVGVLWGDEVDALFYNYTTVAVMLILFGVFFIVVERSRRNRQPSVLSIDDISYRDALVIGCFQLIAAVFPGTSRSGATIVGALMLGIARPVATEFTFFLAIPAMLGASLLKLLKFGFSFTTGELGILLSGMVVAFVVSLLAIKFLVGFVKKHDFQVFGWYRIVLGVIVLVYFLVLS